MRTVRASEIGAFLYCQRAWWYQLQGVKPANQAELLAGTALHQKHWRQVAAAGALRVLGAVLLALALVLLAVYLTQRLLP
jgi:hypothetical protein